MNLQTPNTNSLWYRKRGSITATENLHWDWYSKRGHFAAMDQPDGIPVVSSALSTSRVAKRHFQSFGSQEEVCNRNPKKWTQ
jgi:hypothetical protein